MYRDNNRDIAPDCINKFYSLPYHLNGLTAAGLIVAGTLIIK